jgi:hypothetical protein
LVFGAPIIESDPIIGSIAVSPIIELIVLSVYSHASFTVNESSRDWIRYLIEITHAPHYEIETQTQTLGLRPNESARIITHVRAAALRSA